MKTLISEKEVLTAVKKIADQINQEYAGREVVLVCILKGAVVFLSDLIRLLTKVEVTIDFLAISSYGNGTESSGVVKILKDLDINIEGRDVIIVEDIIDTGWSLDYILRILRQRHPASLKVAVLLSKSSRREINVPIDYLGIEIEDYFVVGYGLDCAGRHRNLPYIGVIETEEE